KSGIGLHLAAMRPDHFLHSVGLLTEAGHWGRLRVREETVGSSSPDARRRRGKSTIAYLQAITRWHHAQIAGRHARVALGRDVHDALESSRAPAKVLG